MDARVTTFLSLHRIAVLSVTLAGGDIHSATCHFSHVEDPFTLFIVTDATTRKVSNMHNDQEVKAGMVIGFSEEEWIELQMSGTAKMVKDGVDFERGRHAFENKFGGELKSEKVIIVFTPQWWRYSEFRRPTPVILENGNSR